jgi:hypothetical protein
MMRRTRGLEVVSYDLNIAIKNIIIIIIINEKGYVCAQSNGFFIIVIFTTAMLEILMISTNMFTVCLLGHPYALLVVEICLYRYGI